MESKRKHTTREMAFKQLLNPYLSFIESLGMKDVSMLKTLEGISFEKQSWILLFVKTS